MTHPGSNSGADLDNRNPDDQYRRMENRLANIETDLATVKAVVANLQENSATKADLAKLEVHLLEKVDTMTWRFISWVTGVMGMGFAAVYYVARNVH
jgi:hypothetical protein